MNIIEIHGRSGYTALIQRVVEGAQVDISDTVIYFEIPAAKLRKRLTVDNVDLLSARLILTREEVENIPTTASVYAIVDESGELPSVMGEGSIRRTGYKGAPS